jgi:hypothetical protein
LVIKLRSKRLAQLFSEVWQGLPEADRALLSKRTKLVVDNPNFLPKGQIPVWGAALGIKFRKSIAIVYLSPRTLPRQSDDFVRYVIAYELAHILCGHIGQLFLSPLNGTTQEEYQERFESEANEQVSLWKFPIISSKRIPKRPSPPSKGVSYRKT